MTRIWGIEYQEDGEPDYPIWRIFIDNPFMYEGKYQVGINQKLLLKAIKSGVQKFILMVGEQEIPMSVPSEKGLKLKVKNGEYEDKPSMFSGSPDMRIYHFSLRE